MATMTPLLDLSWDEMSKAEQIATMDEAERTAFLSSFSDDEIDALEHDWQFWGRPDQHPPLDDQWDVWFLMGGRGSGKTATETHWLNTLAETPNQYFAIIGETAAEVRDVLIEGVSGVIKTAKPWNPAIYEPSKRRVVWPKTGCWATTYSGDSPDQLRGPNVHAAIMDEWAKYRYPDQVLDNLEFILRAGDHPRVCITTTPRPIKRLRELINDSWTRLVRVSTYRNQANLAPTFLRRLLSRYEGTRLGRQEIYAEILEDNPDALWSYTLLDATRVQASTVPPLELITIGVDPPGGLVTECGIVASGRSKDAGFVLADRSVAGKPEVWASTVWSLAQTLAEEYDAPVRIIPERNHGGEMVRSTLEVARPADCLFRIQMETASKGKAARAEPVVMLYEQARYHHVGSYAALEDELTTWDPHDQNLPSPNRLDALVWSAHGLGLIGTQKRQAGVWGR